MDTSPWTGLAPCINVPAGWLSFAHACGRGLGCSPAGGRVRCSESLWSGRGCREDPQPVSGRLLEGQGSGDVDSFCAHPPEGPAAFLKLL